jgi:hypothetical protein
MSPVRHFANGSTLIRVLQTTTIECGQCYDFFTLRLFQGWQERDVSEMTSFSPVGENTVAATYERAMRPTRAAYLQPEFIRTLGVAVAQGALTLDSTEVIVSHRYWQQELGAKADVVGTQIVVDGRPAKISGVMPRSFEYPKGTALWLPL